MLLNGSIVVAGTHRSGTTLIGDVLCSRPGAVQLYEPFHAQHGVDGVGWWYLNADAHRAPGRDLLGDFMRGRARLKHAGLLSSLGHILRRDGERAFAATAWRYRLLRAPGRGGARRVVIKDPFLTFGARRLIEEFDCRVVFTVKHPGAFYLSLCRMGWERSVPVESLVRQGIVGEAEAARADTDLKRTALCWNAVNGYAAAVVERHPGRAAFLHHDSFCSAPADALRAVTDRVGVPLGDGEVRRLRARTSGSVVVPPGAALHVLDRDSRAVGGGWRARISERDLREIAALCGPTLARVTAAGGG